MDSNSREAMGWALASFFSFIAWLAAAQVTLLGEQLRMHDDDGAVHSSTSAVPGRSPEEPPAQPSTSTPEEPGKPFSSLPRYHVGYVFIEFRFEGDHQVRRRVRSPPPVVGRSRTSLDMPLWVPDELNWDRGSIPFVGGHVYRNEGVPPWEEEDDLDRWHMANPPPRDHRIEGFYRSWENRGRPERRHSWPPDARMPPVLRPSGSKASLPELAEIRMAPVMDVRSYLTPEHSDPSSPRPAVDEEE